MGEIINFQPEKQKEIDVKHLEELRDFLYEQKEKRKDPHFDFIDVDKLTDGDLMIFDKLKKHNLTNKEFEEYRNHIKNYINEQENQKGNNFKPQDDSRSNFEAMISNKMVEEEYFRRHPEKRAA